MFPKKNLITGTYFVSFLKSTIFDDSKLREVCNSFYVIK